MWKHWCAGKCLSYCSLYEPRHGYAVMLFIEQKTKGRLRLGAGSLWRIEQLADKGWITPLSETIATEEYVISVQASRLYRGDGTTGRTVRDRGGNHGRISL